MSSSPDVYNVELTQKCDYITLENLKSIDSFRCSGRWIRRLFQDALGEPPFQLFEISAGWCVPSLVLTVPASPVDLGLVLLNERDFEIDAGVGRHWSDSAWASLSLPSSDHRVGEVNVQRG